MVHTAFSAFSRSAGVDGDLFKNVGGLNFFARVLLTFYFRIGTVLRDVFVWSSGCAGSMHTAIFARAVIIS